MEFGLAPDQSRPTFDDMQRQAALAESLGYAALWAHEHHSNAMMYPDPLMALAAMAQVTQRVKLGTSMLLLPIHHPVRVAQEAAMLDVLSGGRVLLGLANGYSKTDLDTFGVSSSHRGRRLEEGVQLIRQLWSGEPVTAKGEDFSLADFEFFPPPVQAGGPPIYIGGHADVAVQRVARIGDNYFISATAGFDQVRQLVNTYSGFMDELGKPGQPVLINRVMCVVENARQKAEAENFYANALLAFYGSWGHANIAHLTDEERQVENLAQANCIIGEVGECVERIKAYADLGIGHIACLPNFGAPPTAMLERSIRLFGERVIPQFS
ncbi:MAG: LLM class flavin-dependent oxidoreductase [Gammaproteobacteria bacterium]